MKNALYILSESAFEQIYGPLEQRDIKSRVNLLSPLETPESIKANPQILSQAEIIFSGWGGPVMDENFLKQAPELKMVFYGAGSIRPIVSDAFWKRSIRITSAYAMNAVPVAEFTLSQILFCLKCGWQFTNAVHKDHDYDVKFRIPIHGGYRSTVGLISLGMIGKLVRKMLRAFEIDVLVYDPFLTQATADELDVTLCNLNELFSRSDVVSLHTPWLKATEGMITGQHLEKLKQFASFINTSRGAVVRENEMIEVLKRRHDLHAVIDTTWPEPPLADSKLYELDNITLTPHIAGSMGKECNRMGRAMVEELDRYLKDEKLLWEIDEQRAAILA